jgi:hypothetical protein
LWIWPGLISRTVLAEMSARRGFEMQTRTAERQNLHELINALSDTSVGKLTNYIDFLRYEERIEVLEDEKDIEYIKSLTPEDYANAVPLEKIIAKYKAMK